MLYGNFFVIYFSVVLVFIVITVCVDVISHTQKKKVFSVEILYLLVYLSPRINLKSP